VHVHIPQTRNHVLAGCVDHANIVTPGDQAKPGDRLNAAALHNHGHVGQDPAVTRIHDIHIGENHRLRR